MRYVLTQCAVYLTVALAATPALAQEEGKPPETFFANAQVRERMPVFRPT
jgi:hypothetical protein